MIFGQSLMSGPEGEALSYYTPWFSREGNEAEMVADIIQISGSANVVVDVETKTTEQSDKAAGTNTSWTSGSLTSKGRKPFTAGAGMDDTGSEGFFELVRFKITVDGLTSSGQEWVHMRMLNPSWQTN